MKVLVTGAAGFIGSHLAASLNVLGHQVLCVDNFSDYYAPDFKKMRVSEILTNLDIETIDISRRSDVSKLFGDFKPDSVIHLAAQAGVRLPVSNYDNYVRDNLLGFSNVAIVASELKVQNFLYASSSSVYGDRALIPYTENEKNLKPNSFYGATKLSNEILASTLSHQTGMRMRGLRFFTVYGPWGRPDMAYFRLISNALVDAPYKLFGDGSIKRDFTYIDDTVKTTIDLFQNLLKQEKGFSDVVNVGGGSPRSINELIQVIGEISNKNIVFENHDPDLADVAITSANSAYLQSLIGNRAFTSLEMGIDQTYAWASRKEISKNLLHWVKSSL